MFKPLLINFFFLFLCYNKSFTDDKHPCNRICNNQTLPILCEFNWTISRDFVLNPEACKNCPYNLKDCFLPDCITANGYNRPVIVVNKALPGPFIEVCQNDLVRVNLFNDMPEPTSIHWHGISQRGTPFYDGPVMVTQCPIPAKTLFKYE
jgi:L-ascorbate oxidase